MLGMKSVGDVPTVQYAPNGEDTRKLPKEERRACLDKIVHDLMKTYDIALNFNCIQHASQQSNPRPPDKVLAYTKQLLSHGCFYLECRDSVKEGDGNRTC